MLLYFCTRRAHHAETSDVHGSDHFMVKVKMGTKFTKRSVSQTTSTSISFHYLKLKQSGVIGTFHAEITHLNTLLTTSKTFGNFDCWKSAKVGSRDRLQIDFRDKRPADRQQARWVSNDTL